MDKLERAIADIKAHGAKDVFVQAPEGLKTMLLDIGQTLEKAGIGAVLSCEPCFGACDLRDAEAKRLGCELLLHLGHTCTGTKTQIPIIYEEYAADAEPAKILERHMGRLEPCHSIGLLTTVQYINSISKAKKFLESKGKAVIVGNDRTNRAAAGPKAKYPGQILGCDISAAKSMEGHIDCFLFMGTGMFHALGVAMAAGKPVLFLDFETGNITDMKAEKERRERIKFANIEKAKECRSFGILVSTKPGQANYPAAALAKRKLESNGRQAWILAMDAIAPEKLIGLKIDCLVNCACPRLSEDAAQFKKPIISPEDVDKL